MSEQKLTNDQLAQLRSYRDGLLEARGIAHSQPTAQGVPAASSPDHVPCAICEEAAKVCDVEAEHIREDERRADSRIVNNPRAVERRGASVELPLVRAAAEIAVQRMVAERCAASIRAACTHATPPRSELADQLEALWKAATPGPWRREFDEHYRHFTVEALPTFVPTVDANFAASEIVAKVADIDNAALIVALVNALPEILTALRRTR